MFIGAHIEVGKGIHTTPKTSSNSGGSTFAVYFGSKIAYKVSHYSTEMKNTFQSNLKEFGQKYPTLHAKLTVNLASPNRETYQKSYQTLQEEIDEASHMGFSYVVFHPNSPGKERFQEGCKQLAEALDSMNIPNGVQVLLENAAGEGRKIGTYMEDLGLVLSYLKNNGRKVGVCLDTAHFHGAGYDLVSSYKQMKHEVEKHVGLSRVKVIHFNDSKVELGSGKDRHEDICCGTIGERGLSNVINDPDFQKCVFICETPGEPDWNINRAKNLKA